MTITAICDAQANVPADVIAELVAAIAGHDRKVDFYSAAATGSAYCILEDGHGGRHGSMIATDDENVSAWLRWYSDTSPNGDWLADCANPPCILFRGHGGGCEDTPSQARTA